MSIKTGLVAGLCLALTGLSACAPSMEERMTTPAIASMDWVKRDAKFYNSYAGQMETIATAFDETEQIVSGHTIMPTPSLMDATNQSMLKISALSKIYGLNGHEKSPALGALELEAFLRANPTNTSVRNDMGVLYLTGAGGRQDFRQAREQFLAAAPKSSEALFNLAIMHYNGYGVPVDYVETHKWLTLATTCTTQVSPGYKGARPALKEVEKALTPEQINASIAGVGSWLSQNATPFDRNPFCNHENADNIRAMLRAERNAQLQAEREQMIAERQAYDQRSAESRRQFEDRQRRRGNSRRSNRNRQTNRLREQRDRRR